MLVAEWVRRDLKGELAELYVEGKMRTCPCGSSIFFVSFDQVRLEAGEVRYVCARCEEVYIGDYGDEELSEEEYRRRTGLPVE